MLVGPISEAVAESTEDRDQVRITREALMGIGFPKVPGRDAWASTEDPDLAEKVFDLLDTDVWGLCDQNPSGHVQAAG